MTKKQPNPYEILGVNENASNRLIYAAYRTQSKFAHPDKKTGSKIKFETIKWAYDILRDKLKRERYDEGLDPNVESNVDAGEMMARDAFLQIIENNIGHLHEIDIIGGAQGGLRKFIIGLSKQCAIDKHKFDELEESANNLSIINGKDNIFREILFDNARILESHIDEKIRQMEAAEIAIIYLDAYEYKFKEQPMVMTSATSSATFG